MLELWHQIQAWNQTVWIDGMLWTVLFPIAATGLLFGFALGQYRGGAANMKSLTSNAGVIALVAWLIWAMVYFTLL